MSEDDKKNWVALAFLYAVVVALALNGLASVWCHGK